MYTSLDKLFMVRFVDLHRRLHAAGGDEVVGGGLRPPRHQVPAAARYPSPGLLPQPNLKGLITQTALTGSPRVDRYKTTLAFKLSFRENHGYETMLGESLRSLSSSKV